MQRMYQQGPGLVSPDGCSAVLHVSGMSSARLTCTPGPSWCGWVGAQRPTAPGLVCWDLQPHYLHHQIVECSSLTQSPLLSLCIAPSQTGGSCVLCWRAGVAGLQNAKSYQSDLASLRPAAMTCNAEAGNIAATVNVGLTGS